MFIERNKKKMEKNIHNVFTEKKKLTGRECLLICLFYACGRKKREKERDQKINIFPKENKKKDI